MPRWIWKGRERLSSHKADELQLEAAQLAVALNDRQRAREMRITRMPERRAA